MFDLTRVTIGTKGVSTRAVEAEVPLAIHIEIDGQNETDKCTCVQDMRTVKAAAPATSVSPSKTEADRTPVKPKTMKGVTNTDLVTSNPLACALEDLARISTYMAFLSV